MVMRVIKLATVTLTITLAAAVVFIALKQPPPIPHYEPPPFEQDAITGIPEVPVNFGYSELDAMGNFTFGIAGVMYQQADGSLNAYFNNPIENVVYLMCEIVSPEGKTLYKSGLLRPGEYVASLNPQSELKNEAVPIEIRIYALEPEHYYSLGTITLDNILQPY